MAVLTHNKAIRVSNHIEAKHKHIELFDSLAGVVVYHRISELCAAKELVFSFKVSQPGIDNQCLNSKLQIKFVKNLLQADPAIVQP